MKDKDNTMQSGNDDEKDTRLDHGIRNWLQDMKLEEGKKEKIAIVFLLGVFLLLIATPVSTFSRKSTETTEKALQEEQNEIKDMKKDEYIEQLENKLEQTIEGMEGAGNVDVMITLEDNGEKILDKDQPYESEEEISKEDNKEISKNRIRNQQQTVLLEKDGNTEPIVIRQRYPEIEGVVVVCEGGGDSRLSLQIKEAVQALFSIDAHKIVVCKSK